ncbi:MAG TPA: nitroreductase, partial [Armatimonadetes bacterium]|nr:nitroreductase [Armatimonadota bacterium]
QVRKDLAEACNGQTWMADAAVIIAGLSLPAVNPKWHDKDVMIALQNMILAATALGYGTCWIGAFNQEKVKAVLHVPEEVNVVALTPVGVPAEAPAARPRKEAADIFSFNEYGQPLKPEALA